MESVNSKNKKHLPQIHRLISAKGGFLVRIYKNNLLLICESVANFDFMDKL